MTPQEELIRSIIQRIAIGPDRGKDISRNEARDATIAVLNDQVDPVHAALFLIGLRMKSETIDEYLGVYDGIDSLIDSQESKLDHLLYLADPYDGYVRNIPTSPFLPAILSACGIPSVIQGVESVGPKFGVTAHQVYKQLGIDPLASITSNVERLEKPEIAWAYIDQSVSQAKLAALNSFRDLIVKRTALTTVERMVMPIRAKKNLLALGFVHKAYPEIYGALAQGAGFDNATLIKGLEGGVTPALDKPVRSFLVDANHIHDKQVGELDGKLSTDNILSATFEGSAETLLNQTIDEGVKALKTKQGNFYEMLLSNSAYLMWKFSAMKELDEGQLNNNFPQTFEDCCAHVKDVLATKEVLNRLGL